LRLRQSRAFAGGFLGNRAQTPQFLGLAESRRIRALKRFECGPCRFFGA
jgi:hypothetical protein